MTARCPTDDQLQAFLVGEMAEESLQTVASHVEQCPRCEAKARQLDGTLDSVLEALRDPTAVIKPPDSGPASHVEDPFSTRVDRPATVHAKTDYSFLKPPLGAGEIGRLAGYRVLSLLGQGGMAYIFRAEDINLHRAVALKVMKPDLGRDTDAWARFLREARVMAAIEHEHVVTVHQVGQDGNTVFLAMELLPGETLDAWMKRTPRPDLKDAVRLGMQIASGLAVIHAHGIVHRDIKPSNLWLQPLGDAKDGKTSDLRVKILDFGLARAVKDNSDLTKTGTVMGTPAFMSPEQARGKKVDARSDLFSLGCILYALCTGQRPFNDEHTLASLTSLAVDTPPSIHEVNPSAPVELADLVDDLLSKDPEDRPASADEVLQRLAAIGPLLGDPGVVTPRAMANVPPRPARPKATATQAVRAGAPSGSPRRKSRKTGRMSRQSSSRQRTLLFAAIGGALALVIVVVALVMRRQAGPVEKPPENPLIEPTFLTELIPTATAENWPFVHGSGKGKDKKPFKGKESKEPPKEPPKVEQGIVVKGRPSPHGIFMHPPPPPAEGEPASLTFKLGGKYARFRAEVALNDGQEAESPQIFSVYGDGKKLWTSKPVQTTDDRQVCDIPIRGVDALKIEVVSKGGIFGAHAVWVEPSVSK